MRRKREEILNKEYYDDIVSTKLIDVDDAVAQMTRSLVLIKVSERKCAGSQLWMWMKRLGSCNVQERIRASQTAIESELDELNHILQKRKQAAKAKEVLSERMHTFAEQTRFQQ